MKHLQLIKITVMTLMVLFIHNSCDINEEERSVTYRISNNHSGFDVTYRIADGSLNKATIDISSKEDIWTYNFTGTEGDIVYVSANYKDINTGIRIQILLDGKTFKQGSSLYDTLNFVTVSGTIPYK